MCLSDFLSYFFTIHQLIDFRSQRNIARTNKSIQSLPKLFALSFLELLEVPLRLDLFRVVHHCALLADKTELHSVDRLAYSDVNDRKTFFNDFLALLVGLVRVPFVSNQSQTKVFRKSNCNVVTLDKAAVHVDSCQERLAIFKSCNNEVVVVRILVVSFFVTDSAQVVGVILDSEVNVVIVGFGLSCEFVHFSCGFLEVSVFASCSQDNAFGKFFNSVNVGVL